MDDSKIQKIKNNIYNNLSQINIDAYITNIKHSSSVNECIEFTKDFTQTIIKIKDNISLYLSEELDVLKKILEENEISNNILNNEFWILFNNTKNIISQNKIKIKSISININDIYSNLNLINSNLEKKKYSLASSRISKILQIKNNILSNVKQLDENQQKLLDEFKSDKFIKNKIKNSNNNSIVKIRPAPTPFPSTDFFDYKDNNNMRKKTNIINNNRNLNNNSESLKKRMINKRKRDFSFSLKEHISNTRNNSLLKGYNTINNFYKKENENKKEEELKKKLLNQKGINDKLNKEIERIKEKLNKYEVNSKSDQSHNNNSNNIDIMIQNIINFKEKINIVSDILFSLTFLFNNLQNKYKINNENDNDYSDIKKKLLEITTEISELKSLLLKISIENEDYSNQMTLSSSGLIKNTNQSINFEYFTNNENILNDKEAFKNNNNLKESINLDKSQQKISLIESQIIELENNLSKEKKLNEKLKKKNIELTNKLEEKNKNYLDNNISLSLSSQSNNEILSLKEKLRINEKKIIELKNIYESDIESKNIIEKLLKKNIEEMKILYEQKIIKYKKKYEEKEKELSEERKKLIEEEMNIINKIKNDNEENIKKLRNIYESKVNSNIKYFNNLKEEKSINLIIININNESSFDKEELEKRLENMEEEKNNIEKEKKNLQIINEKERLNFRESNNKNMNTILELKDEILKYKNKESELNEEIINLKRENDDLINKTKIFEDKVESYKLNNDEVERIKKEKLNILEEINIIKENNNKLEKEKINLNKELSRIKKENKEEIDKIKEEKEKIIVNNEEISNKLSKKDKEIITLITNNTKEKKSIIERNKNEIEKLKLEFEEKIKLKENNYKEQINILHKKLSNEKIIKTSNNISIEKVCNFILNLCNNKKLYMNQIQKNEIILNIISNKKDINISRKKSKISNSMEESNEEESDDFYDYEEEDPDEFLKKMKKINKKFKLDNEELKSYKKENRKMISKFEDTLDEVDELKEKMISIEKLVSEKQELLYNSLKKYFNMILVDINLTKENRENIIYFMKLMQFSDNDIKIITSNIKQNDNKKKIQFNIFK